MRPSLPGTAARRRPALAPASWRSRAVAGAAAAAGVMAEVVVVAAGGVVAGVVAAGGVVAAVAVVAALPASAAPASPVAPRAAAPAPGAPPATVTPAAPAPTCLQQPGPDCLYVPSAAYAFAVEEHATSYSDEAGASRDVPMTIRVPIGAPSPMPVVVWSHGGADGHLQSTTAMREWSETTARAGYVTIAVAHRPRDRGSREALCRAIGTIADDACEHFKYLNWDRPHDLRATLDEIDRMAASGALAGRIDVRRLAVGGHSAGAGGAFSLAGARRSFGGPPIALDDPRPAAFLAFSPQQPGNEGFFDTDFDRPDHSWIDVHRPVLVGTGDGDRTCQPGPEPGSCIGEQPYGRRIAFQRLPADGNKAHVYLHDAQAFHTLFALETSRCAALDVPPDRCREMARWLTAAALAFLDGQVQRLPAALQWLASDRLQRASAGVAQWQLR